MTADFLLHLGINGAHYSAEEKIREKVKIPWLKRIHELKHWATRRNTGRLCVDSNHHRNLYCGTDLPHAIQSQRKRRNSSRSVVWVSVMRLQTWDSLCQSNPLTFNVCWQGSINRLWLSFLNWHSQSLKHLRSHSCSPQTLAAYPCSCNAIK